MEGCHVFMDVPEQLGAVLRRSGHHDLVRVIVGLDDELRWRQNVGDQVLTQHQPVAQRSAQAQNGEGDPADDRRDEQCHQDHQAHPADAGPNRDETRRSHDRA